ncbi:hypothetical protein K9M79_05220 [Candidatus Woesearchaeota archaeon]|nr:hypothetical protein [Candidatus Woesearchaeota archaeon]
MSLHFFDKKLLEAKENLTKGDEESITRALDIIKNHTFDKRDSLKDAQEDLKKGDEKSIKDALNIVDEHGRQINEDLIEEAKVFQDFLNITHSFSQTLKTAHESISKGDYKEGSIKIDQARRIGREIIVYAKKIVRLCKDEELEAIC